MSKLNDFYKQILKLGGLVTDKDGLVSATIDDSTVPFTVKGKRLALPTKENMGKTADLVIFHPLSENFLRGESEVMQRYRSAINTRLNYVLGCLMEEMLTLITSAGEHQKLTPEQSEVLSVAHEADEGTLTRFTQLLKAMGLGDKEKSFVNIYLKKTASIKGKVYKRGAIVTFPFYKELIKKEKSVYGVTLRIKDREAIQKLLEFIIPGIGEDDAYNQGSSGDVSPFLESLLKGLIGVAANINSIATSYKDFLALYDNYVYNADWVDTMENIHLLETEIRLVPMQAGNEGSIMSTNPSPPQLSVAPPVQESVHSQPQQTYAANTAAMRQNVATPVQQSQGRDPSKVSFSDLDQRNRQTTPMQQQINPAWGHMPMQQNVWQQYLPQPVSGPVAARQSISSLSVLASAQPPSLPINQVANNYGWGNQLQSQNSFI
jgi:hypothetical protein